MCGHEYHLSTAFPAGDPPLTPVLRDVGQINMFFRVESGPPTPGWVPVTGDGLTRERVAEEVELVRARLGALSGGRAEDVEWRVGASLFHQGLASRLLSPVLAAALCHGVRLRAGRFLLEPERAGALVLRTAQTRAEPMSDRPGEVVEWLDQAVVGGVLAGVEAVLAGVGRISPGLLRGNTASALAGAARALGGARPDHRSGVEEVVRLMLERPSLKGAGAYTGVDRSGAAVFRRTTCCLYYRLPEGGLCGDCALRS
ncbi:(2Fe-2S)-binding protein [Nocardiopsis terrae]